MCSRLCALTSNTRPARGLLQDLGQSSPLAKRFGRLRFGVLFFCELRLPRLLCTSTNARVPVLFVESAHGPCSERQNCSKYGHQKLAERADSAEAGMPPRPRGGVLRHRCFECSPTPRMPSPVTAAGLHTICLRRVVSTFRLRGEYGKPKDPDSAQMLIVTDKSLQGKCS